MQNQIIEAIKNRRSVRVFTGEPVSEDMLKTVLEAGRWAPSGQNNQPWRFVVVESSAKKDELSEYTKYTSIIRGAAVCIAVFADLDVCYHPVKDAQSVGACLQNMLLAAHASGLGAVWLGQILAQADGVRTCLGLGENMVLQAVLAIGHPARRDQSSNRQPLETLIAARY